jgi:hypothetical protein
MRYVHEASACEGEFCPIHNPSKRAESIGYTHWRGDRRIMERICKHGVGHPDPDDIRVRHGGRAEQVHGCDGCCNVMGMAMDEQGTYGIAPNLDKRPGDPVSYKESWNDLKSAIQGVKLLYGDDVIKVEYLLDYMEKKEQRMQ